MSSARLVGLESVQQLIRACTSMKVNGRTNAHRKCLSKSQKNVLATQAPHKMNV